MFAIRTVRALTLVALLVANFSYADENKKQNILSKGQIACVSRKMAINYAKYVSQAPEFADDLIARADCFVVKEDMSAIPLENEKGFQRYKLLTGHTVWAKR